jgi:hypothetical protein
MEVVLGVTPAAGKTASSLIIEPKEADRLDSALSSEYAGATLAVLDVSPFPRTCVARAAACCRWAGSRCGRPPSPRRHRRRLPASPAPSAAK